MAHETRPGLIDGINTHGAPVSVSAVMLLHLVTQRGNEVLAGSTSPGASGTHTYDSSGGRSGATLD